jgi:hypothetical protein
MARAGKTEKCKPFILNTLIQISSTNGSHIEIPVGISGVA